LLGLCPISVNSPFAPIVLSSGKVILSQIKVDIKIEIKIKKKIIKLIYKLLDFIF